jgi:MFS family permease
MGAGYLVSGAGVALLALLTADSSYATVAVAQVIMGVGIGAAFMPAMSIATQGVEPQDLGVASAMISTSQQVGGSIGTALLNTIAASSTATYLATHASNASHKAALVHGFSTAYLWGAGFLVIASAISLIAVNADRPKHVSPRPPRATAVLNSSNPPKTRKPDKRLTLSSTATTRAGSALPRRQSRRTGSDRTERTGAFDDVTSHPLPRPVGRKCRARHTTWTHKSIHGSLGPGGSLLLPRQRQDSGEQIWVRDFRARQH